MSTKLTGYVWDGCAASGMKLSSVAIMARLADFSNDEGVCWPSIETIARQIGAGMSTVRTAIARLEAEGWLTRKARRQGNRNASNVYQLNVAKLQAAAFSQLSDSDPSKSDASKSDPSKFDASKSGKKAGFHPSESGGDPSVKSKHDPSDKKPSRPDASQPDTQTDEQDFLTRHPDAVVFSPKKRQWGTQDDLTCAQWLWKKIIALYEHAAECDGEVVRPKEPNWTAWANEIRLMCRMVVLINKSARCTAASVAIRSGAVTCSARRSCGKNGMSFPCAYRRPSARTPKNARTRTSKPVTTTWTTARSRQDSGGEHESFE